jgi:hypothetical protein
VDVGDHRGQDVEVAEVLVLLGIRCPTLG